MKTKRKQGMVIETIETKFFKSEVRFLKEDAEFVAEMPIGFEPERDESLSELRSRVKEKLKDWVPEGKWVKKIFIEYERRSSVYAAGQTVNTDLFDMNFGFDVFEVFEPPPNGKVFTRRLGETHNGREDGWLFHSHKDALMDWTQEREDALTAIREGLTTLSKRIAEVLKDPERLQLGGNSLQKMLGSGE